MSNGERTATKNCFSFGHAKAEKLLASGEGFALRPLTHDLGQLTHDPGQPLPQDHAEGKAPRLPLYARALHLPYCPGNEAAF